MFLFWKPKAPIPPEDRVPVTLLSGFLGAGKTTLLNHLLASEKNGKLAVLVNDLGEVNIDASLIKRSVRKLKSPISGMMELTSGCICCGIQTELMDALLHLYRKYQPDHADRLSASLRGINAKATVLRCEQGQIDAEALLGQSHFDEEATLTAARWRRLILTEQGDVDDAPDVSQPLNLSFGAFQPIADPPSRNQDGSGLRIERKPPRHHNLDYGLDSFVFKGRRPFDESRFYRFLRSELPGLVRAKGFYWTTRMPDRVGLLSIAGKPLLAAERSII